MKLNGYLRMAFLFLSLLGTRAAVRSDFELGKDGWTQINLSGDVRYTLPLEGAPEPGECTLVAPSLGALAFVDVDAGDWMFEAPAKFLGDQSGLFAGTIAWRQYWTACDPWIPPVEPEFRVILVNSNIAVVVKRALPPMDQWITNRLQVEASAGWLWVDDEAPQEDLQPATNEQIKSVLARVTGFRILGEFIIGDDLGAIDDVAFLTVEDARPTLEIRWVSATRLRVSWAEAVAGYGLQAAGDLGALSWQGVATVGNEYEFEVATGPRFFRLKGN